MKLEKTVLLMALVIGRTKKGESVLILVKSKASSTGVMAVPVPDKCRLSAIDQKSTTPA